MKTRKVRASINSDDRSDRSTCRSISSLTSRHSRLVSIPDRRRRSIPKRAILMIRCPESHRSPDNWFTWHGCGNCGRTYQIPRNDCIIGIESGCYA